MNVLGRIAAILAVTSSVSFPLGAQPAESEGAAPDGTIAGPEAEATPSSIAESSQAVPAPESAPDAAVQDSGCELHVWPTNNYIGFNSGLLSGFGIVGALVDEAAHENRVKSVKDLMRDYLGPEIQLAELEKVGYRTVLGKQDYRLIIQEPTPFNEDLKGNPELKAKVKVINAKIKSGERLTDSKAPCYAEFLILNVFYHKAMMYGSNLFVGTLFRDYSGGGAPRVSSGAVKNPLEDFPPKSPDMVEKAQAELRDAFGRDFVEWSEKKLLK